jgi:hypothetical protein
MTKPLMTSSPYIYWSDSQVRAVIDQNSKGNRKMKFESGWRAGFQATASVESSDPVVADAPRAQRQEVVERLLSGWAARQSDPNCIAEYAIGESHAYWGWLRLPNGDPSHAAMFGMDFRHEGNRVLLALFGPRRNLTGLVESDNSSDLGAVQEGSAAKSGSWSSSSWDGQRILLDLGSFDPLDLQLTAGEGGSAADAAITILKGQGAFGHNLFGPYRHDSGLIAEALTSWCAHIYSWNRDVYHGGNKYDLVGVGAPLWVRALSQRKALVGQRHRAGLEAGRLRSAIQVITESRPRRRAARRGDSHD